MKLEDFKEFNRLLESQQILRDVMHEAIGVYMAKEPKIKDQWREMTLWGIWEHLKHEIEEIDRSGTKDRTYHNILDAIGLLAMLGYRIQEHNKKK